ncbi:DpnD/PcfM family protein [Capnocytophaga cynodegmi]|uniref:DpnD/PcfM family protein n=1 Tax=Capnocytophaga cynodegmi TaxID=28189 RepID=UPI00385C34F4
MKTYEVEIKEILSRIVSIKAENEQEAIRKIAEQYKKEEIVLDADDFVLKEIRICRD